MSDGQAPDRRDSADGVVQFTGGSFDDQPAELRDIAAKVHGLLVGNPGVRGRFSRSIDEFVRIELDREEALDQGGEPDHFGGSDKGQEAQPWPLAHEYAWLAAVHDCCFRETPWFVSNGGLTPLPFFNLAMYAAWRGWGAGDLARLRAFLADAQADLAGPTRPAKG